MCSSFHSVMGTRLLHFHISFIYTFIWKDEGQVIVILDHVVDKYHSVTYIQVN